MQTYKKVEPTQTYTARTNNYSDDWYEQHLADAHFDLAKDEYGRDVPFCTVIFVNPNDHQMFGMDVNCFKSNRDMIAWITAYGCDKVKSVKFIN